MGLKQSETVLKQSETMKKAIKRNKRNKPLRVCSLFRWPSQAKPPSTKSRAKGRKEGPNADTDNTNRGVLFRNNDKTDDKHADYRGNINVNGEEFWLNAWINESKNGMKYM
jgi:hypothetical protein